MNWQKIETAPKDGTGVILAIRRGFGSKILGVTMGSYGINGREQWTTAGNCPLSPTHWMPLPPPPIDED
jgi:hypothetical protein